MIPKSFTQAQYPARAQAQARTAALVKDYCAWLSLLNLALLLVVLNEQNQTADAVDEEINAVSKSLDIEGKPRQVMSLNGASATFAPKSDSPTVCRFEQNTNFKTPTVNTVSGTET
jgi:hypothetical protein